MTKIHKYEAESPDKSYRNPILSADEQQIVDNFACLQFVKHKDSSRSLCINWRGYECIKTPADLIAYQEIIHETKPNVIIETGTRNGGGTMFLAEIGKCQVITVDVEQQPDFPDALPIHKINASSTSQFVMDEIAGIIAANPDVRPRVMVILDSDHSKEHVAKELELYAPLVTKGCYLVVEDTFLSGNPLPRYNVGDPMPAVIAFMQGNEEFEVDRSRERFLNTVSPHGFLKRIK